MIISGEEVARFVSGQCGFGLCPPYSAIGIQRDGKIVAGALFNQFEGRDVHVTIAGKGWSRSFIDAVGHYVFGQLGCSRMTATTEQMPVVRIAERLGGQVEGRLRNHFGPGRDGIIVGILREEWNFGKFAPETGAAEHLHALPGRGSVS